MTTPEHRDIHQSAPVSSRLFGYMQDILGNPKGAERSDGDTPAVGASSQTWDDHFDRLEAAELSKHSIPSIDESPEVLTGRIVLHRERTYNDPVFSDVDAVTAPSGSDTASGPRYDASEPFQDIAWVNK